MQLRKKRDLFFVEMFFLLLSQHSFPPQYIGSLLGVMWTLAGIISFATYGLVRLAKEPTDNWRVGKLFYCAFS